MEFLHNEIGAARDNQRSPIHNWYKFTAGFSYKFVEEIIKLEKSQKTADYQIFDPFAGCGTTLVSSQKEGMLAVGNEAQSFMYEVIKAKLNWKIRSDLYTLHLSAIKNYVDLHKQSYNLKRNAHPLLLGLYENNSLKSLYLIKEAIDKIEIERYRLFFKLALSQTLHKVSIHPIAVPYISRNKIHTNIKPVWDVFSTITDQMFKDCQSLYDKKHTGKIYLHDSRKPNKFIKNKQCQLCITSPPYLNNLDYGEVAKVHTHFFGVTDSWNDITNRVRKKLVTAATTHYVESEFELESFLNEEFAIQNNNIIQDIISKASLIKEVAKVRSGKKSFDILMLYYFRDMFLVLKEIKRVLSPNAKAYLILGDSAPYGIFIPTTEILGKIALNIGFTEYKIYKIRSRGTKWKSLQYRHNMELSENVLVLK